ncbi:potassium/sodium efflux P-type ATPase [Basidiobolus meristosporus CBS 931.73]|uniref:P-type Na(+) transporter n=1 Tax=Basidiobolus meristosporus CBS 931.73 TaxID=1314790 RepID=A0A1Y1YIW6_9FUNG|nr:potassium/sodium efflux P-type ATPase [Basidiobolus meristosporus CBS 931.73]|eukprot:ORX97929.1 potassium/sodium efflux P-type ATPase [Basidiobolus meristosporus CBS 931.73]
MSNPTTEAPLPYHTYDIQDTAQKLDTNLEDGLSSQQVQERLQQYGHNQMSGNGGVSPWKVLFRQIANSLTIILVAAMAIAFSAKDWVEGAVIGVVIITNTTIGFFQEYRAEKTMDSLRKMASPTSRVMRDGNLAHISTNELVPGDILVFENGDVIGADARLFEQFNLEVDEALLTGESLPVPKTLETLTDPDEPIGDRINLVYSSTTVTKGRGRGVVIATGMQSEIGKIAKSLIESSGDSKTKLQKSMDKMGYLLFIFALLLGVVVFAVNKFRITAEVAIYAISLGIAVIPEGLIAVVTLTMAAGVRSMAKNKAIIRQLNSLEALGSVTNICSDKTGTLTQSKMVMTKAYIPGDGYYHISGAGFIPEGQVIRLGEISANDLAMAGSSDSYTQVVNYENMGAPLRRVVEVSSLCNMATLKHDKTTGEWIGVGDPTETALQVFATKVGRGRPALTQKTDNGHPEFSLHAEFPFDSTVKRMSVVYTEEKSGKHIAYMKGATERVIGCCSRIKIGDREETIEKPDQLSQMIGYQVEQLASNGLRVLSLAYRYIEPQLSETHPDYWTREQVERDMVFVGLVGIYDPPRAESKESVEQCARAGIRVHMLTGDHPATAAAIAREVSIIPPNYRESKEGPKLVMTAMEFDALTDQEIDDLEELPYVIARCSPDTKVKMIKALHRRKKIAAMTGDGVNDSPSLKIANVGIAMGMAGSDVAKQASDIVLTDDNFATIVRAVEEGRRIFANIQKFVLHLMSGNVSEVIALVIGLCFADSSGLTVYPMSPVQILFLNMVTSSPPAMALGLEPNNPLTMRMPPRSPTSGIFTLEIISDILVYGTLMGGLSLLNFVLVVFGFGDGNLGHDCNSAYSDACDLVFRARGAAFSCLTLLILLHAYNCRSLREPQWLPPGIRNYYSNRPLFWSIFLGCGLLIPVLYIPYVNTSIFKHQYLTWEWAVVGVSVLIFLAASELYKLIKRRTMKPNIVLVDDEKAAY